MSRPTKKPGGSRKKKAWSSSVATSAASSGTVDGWSDDIPLRLNKAVDDYNLQNTPDWEPLSALSANTEYQGIEAHGEATIKEGKSLVTPATVYVKLVYDPNSQDSVEFSDEYPARVRFRIQNGAVEIEEIDVDTSSFYE